METLMQILELFVMITLALICLIGWILLLVEIFDRIVERRAARQPGTYEYRENGWED